jgi:tetratricopeptide (TPR) repeat protein
LVGRAIRENDSPFDPNEGGIGGCGSAGYEEARRIYERLVADGRRELERELASLCHHKALIHEHLKDGPGALALYDRALGIYERLVNEEGRRELANDLAKTYMNKGAELQDLGDLQAAVTLYDGAIEIYERLVQPVGWDESKTNPSDEKSRKLGFIAFIPAYAL